MAAGDDRGGTYGLGFFIGFLAGTAIGAALGVLLAPKPGAELRADIRDAAERGTEAFRKAGGVRSQESAPGSES